MMVLNLRKLVAMALAFLLLLGFVPAGAEEGGDVQPPLFTGPNTVHLQVEIEESPGVFKPAEGILVAHKHERVASNAFYALTDPEGKVALEGLPNGTAVVYLEVQDTAMPDGTNYAYPTGYVRDEQPYYLQLGHLNREVSLSLRITLRAAEEPATGAIRVQKGFYPYFLFEDMAMVPHSDLVVFEGEQVLGAEFAVYEYNSDENAPKRYWSEAQRDFVYSLDLATRYHTKLNGQVLIDHLPPGQYLLQETSPPAGSALPDKAGRIANDPYGPFSPQPFFVEENAVVSKHTPVINTPAHFIAMFMKGDAAFTEEDFQPVAGAEFVVYRLVDGKEEYLFYRVPLQVGAPIIAAFTEDIGRAHEFTSGEFMGAAYPFFAVMGLPSYAPDTQQPITYYLKETTAAPGYLINEEPYPFTHLQAIDIQDADFQPLYQDRYCQIKFATLDSVYHVTLPVYPVI